MVDVAEHPEAAEAPSITNLPIDPSTPLFRVRPFRLLLITRVASTTAVQMLDDPCVPEKPGDCQR